MPTELVLLSDVEPTTRLVVRAVAAVMADATLVDYRDGQIRQFLDGAGNVVLQVYRSRPVVVSREAAAAVGDGPSAFGLWTDLTIPFGDTTAGRMLAGAIADAVGGQVAERS
jgi:hypothetical protein